MQRSFSSIALLFLCLLAGPTLLQAQTPVEFNNKLVTITNNLSAKGQEWNVQFKEASKTGNYTTLAPSRQRLERFIDEKLTEVSEMKDVNDSKALRQTMLDFLVFEKGMINKAFKPLESLPKNATEAQTKEALDKLKIYSQEEKVSIGFVNKAQESYARANGFSFTSPVPAAANK